MKILTAERLRELLDYHPESGTFRWRINRNGVRFGSVAGTVNKKGRRRIRADGRKYYASRLAWLYVHGRWPTGVVDHRNGNSDDNRIANLREATLWQNAANIKRTAPNSNGFIGIARNGAGWMAQIRHRNEPIYLGTFPTKEEAHQVYVRSATAYRAEYAAMYPDPLPPLASAATPLPLVRAPADKTEITAERLKQVLSYDPETGIFYWLVDGRFGRSRHRAGEQAGSKRQDGYLTVMIDRTRYPLHRLAWLYANEKHPAKWIDHINGDRADNRIVNLREATPAQNGRNGRGWRVRKAPLKGAYAVKNQWRASISENGRKRHLGYFATAEEAHAAYMAAARLFFGEFANGGVHKPDQ